MHLLSWNLFGLESDELDARTEAACFLTLMGAMPERVFSGEVAPREPPEVLLFQEVVERSLSAHLRPHLSAAGYALISSSQERSYFEVLAVRAPAVLVGHRVHRLDSRQGRELLEAEIDLDGRRWRVLTGHLESMPEGADHRLAQARGVLDRLATHDGPAVFAGDTNLRDLEASTLDTHDAWTACGSDPRSRFTYFSVRSARKARYDRVWGHDVDFGAFRTLGGARVTPKGRPPSDHLAVEVQLTPR